MISISVGRLCERQKSGIRSVGAPNEGRLQHPNGWEQLLSVEALGVGGRGLGVGGWGLGVAVRV